MLTNVLELPRNLPVCIISDIHGCYNELIILLSDNKGVKIENGVIVPKTDSEMNIGEIRYKFILVGDYIDKGPKVKETIEFLYRNQSWFDIVVGNHENFVYKYITGKLDHDKNTLLYINGFFTTAKLLELPENKILKDKFIELNMSSFNFIESKDFIVTHSPCHKKYLGLTDGESLGKQRSFQWVKRIDCESDEQYFTLKEEGLQYLIDEADENDKYHIFGHIMTQDIFEYKNKIGIDTGCVIGGELTCALFDGINKRPKFQSYKSLQTNLGSHEPLLNFFREIKEKDYASINS
jgi:hypothetical protein